MANPEDLGRYRLKRLLGRGVLGEVWEATDLEQPGSKVVKIMHAADDELAIARMDFARDARLAANVRHPNVVTVHDAGEAAGTSFLVMDMVEGESLRKVIANGRATTDEKVRWLREIADGLAALHAAGVVHRDLKPENVIVRPDRSACLVDLGIAKWMKFDLGGERDPELAFERASEPPPFSPYVPPETVDRQLWDELGDQYAWAVVGHELVAGELPTPDAPALADRDDLPVELGRVLDRARSPAREDRFPGMDDILDDLGGPPPPAVAVAPAADAASATSSAPPDAETGPDEVAPPDAATSAAPAGAARGVSPLLVGAILVLVALALALALR